MGSIKRVSSFAILTYATQARTNIQKLVEAGLVEFTDVEERLSALIDLFTEET